MSIVIILAIFAGVIFLALAGMGFLLWRILKITYETSMYLKALLKALTNTENPQVILQRKGGPLGMKGGGGF